MTSTFLNQGNGENSSNQGSSSEDNNQYQEQQQQFSQEQQQLEQDNYFLKVGDRVFKTKEDALNHIDHAQNHISKLESDFEAATNLVDRQQELLERAKKVDDLMDAVGNNQQNSSGNAEETTQLSKEEVIADAVKAFEQRQMEQTQAQQAEQNWNLVTNTLTQAYGDKTDEVVQKVASDNGLEVREAAEMARKHPKVFLNMFDVSKTNKPSAQPTRSSVNTEGLPDRGPDQNRRPFMRMNSRDRASRVHQMLQELDNS